MCLTKPEISRMKFEGFSRYKLDRDLSELRPGKWSRTAESITDHHPRMVYRKISRNTDLEVVFAELERAEDNRKRRNAESEDSFVDETRSFPIREPVSKDVAVKITEEMMCSFSDNRNMRELLEGALHFAGAVTLGGALGPRRARTQITRFELN